MRIHFDYPGLEKYKEYLENQGLKEHTISDYMYYMNRFVINYGKPDTLNDIRIKEIFVDIIKNNQYCTPIRYSLVAYLNMIRRDNLYAEVRHDNRKLLSSKGNKNDIDRYLTEAELINLFNGLSVKTNSNVNMYLICKLLYETASRISEILEAKVKDVDFDNKKINLIVKKKIQNVHKIRTLTDKTIEDLRYYISTRKLTPEDHLFKVGIDSFNMILRRASKKLIGRYISSHYFRATMLTSIALNPKMGLFKAQRFAEHTSILTTQRYISKKMSEVSDQDLKSITDNIG